MDTIWQLKSYQDSSDLMEKLLNERGINSKLEKEIYLESDLKYLSDPFLLPDMEKAVQRIKKALKNKEKILIYGDYDVDGITSTALLYRFFKSAFNYQIDFFLPDRVKDGYGLNISSLEKIVEQDIDLIITVDCGITAFAEAKYLKEKEIDLIITDHHTPGERLPAAAAVINHHLVNVNNYFAADIAGVGTAYKLAQAVSKKAVVEHQDTLLPLAAIGTVADIAPLKNENRIIVKQGLDLIAKNEIIGLKILLKNLNLDSADLTAGQIAYLVAPPLNAAGRINNAEKALKLLITESEREAEKISQKLIKINKQRQLEEEKIYNKAEAKIQKIDLEKEKSIILADPNWHSGIIGIVASRLLEKYHLPVILFAVDKKNKTAKGSARSINSLNIYSALNYCKNQLLSFGGHKAAAGLSIKLGNLTLFKNSFKKYLQQNLKAKDYLKKKKIDLNLNLEQLDKNLIKRIDQFKPFGIANPSPKFIFRNLTTKNCYQIGKEKKHLKFYLKGGLEAVAFNYGKQIDDFNSKTVDLIAEPEINNWKGRNKLQLKVNDYRLCSKSSTALTFEKNNIIFYDLRNSVDKFKKLKQLLKNEVINKAAVYINQKSERKKMKNEFKNHYFFGNDYQFDNRFSHLIFYSLPFSLKQFYCLTKKFKTEALKVEERAEIFLLFSKKDGRYNEKLIEYINDKEIAAAAKNGLDFKDSVRYNKLSKRIDNFEKFKQLIFKENLFAVIEKLVNFEEDNNES